MTSTIRHISAISLFVEDLHATKAFYQQVFGAEAVYEDENSAAFRFDNLIINLLRVESAPEIIEPGQVGGRDAGSRFQLSIWVPDVDAVCAELPARGARLLTGPHDRPWGMRTATFIDPAGHSWEVAQQLAATDAP
jgi:catechol 2,3-dioxygenase-like lactoylglutathione lyase family enzyme